jgi:aminoglycoside phosphotransferase (APT) family kinase protein
MDERLERFVAKTVGGAVSKAERASTGASRVTWLLEAAGQEWVLRVDSGDGPVAGTELSLAREATVYVALRDTSVRIPKLLAVTPERDAILMERIHGTEDLNPLDNQGRAELMGDYVDALAELHSLDPGKLDLPGIERPQTASECARNEIELWSGILEKRVSRPAPLARFAFAWLDRRVPNNVEREVLCHGDVGPGNFLFEDGRVTGLLDWEFAHVGDPMDDLAALAFRGHHYHDNIGDFGAQLERWSDRTGLPIDTRRIAYYRVFLMLRWLVSCVSALDASSRALDRSVYLLLVPALEALLPRAMAQFDGLAWQAAPPQAVRASRLTEVLDVVAEDLASEIAPAVVAGSAAKRMGSLQALMSYACALASLGDGFLEQEADAMAEVLGRRIADRSEALAAIEGLVERSSAQSEDRLLRFFLDQGDRAVAACPPMAPMAAKPLLHLDSSE